MTKVIRNAMPATPKARRVAMLIYPGVTPLDVAGPLEVFSFANILRKQQIYDVVTVGPTAGPVTTKAGIASVKLLPGDRTLIRVTQSTWDLWSFFMRGRS